MSADGAILARHPPSQPALVAVPHGRCGDRRGRAGTQRALRGASLAHFTWQASRPVPLHIAAGAWATIPPSCSRSTHTCCRARTCRPQKRSPGFSVTNRCQTRAS